MNVDQGRITSVRATASAVAGVALFTSMLPGIPFPCARAEPVFTTTHGIAFSTIGDLGNPVVPQSVGPSLYLGKEPVLIGSVGYEYRIARTETTVEQWHEFVTAYRPYYNSNPNTIQFTGTWIFWSGAQQKYIYDPTHARFATNPSWRVAAAYCNWLHNDKVNEAWAFATGAYDTSTFSTNPDGTVNDQATHAPGARFWIPTLDEWTKAMYWDPDRFGPGQGGYWKYPHASDAVPISGLPGVGQTNGGLSTAWENYLPIVSYPDIQSPWGLWDGSGSETEWIENLELGRWRLLKGTEPGRSPWPQDWIDFVDANTPAAATYGIRIAAAVPSPFSAGVCLAAIGVLSMNRRRS